MDIENLNTVQKLARRIGLKTFGELYKFKQMEVFRNETLLQALIRYNNELGKDFEIREVIK